MLATLRSINTQLAEILEALDPASLHALDAVKILEAATAAEKRAGAIRTLVADRAADAAEWARSGYRSPEEWLAAKAGTSYGQARDTLEASAKLKELPETTEALRNGELSSSQVNEIGPAATPENEERLLNAVRNENHHGLRKTCAQEGPRSVRPTTKPPVMPGSTRSGSTGPGPTGRAPTATRASAPPRPEH